MERTVYFSKVVRFMFLVGAVIFLSVPFLQASPIVITGDYVYTQISDDGTLGNGENYPGIQYDPSGTGTFPGTLGKDFLQPGSPWEGFSVKSEETGVVANNNVTFFHTDMIPGTLTDLSASSPYDYYIRWAGTYFGYFEIVTDLYLNNNDQSINFMTTLKALTDLTNVSFARYIDPDQDVNDYNLFNTNNYRGYGVIPEANWVYAVGPDSNWTIGLFSDSSITHNTGVSDTPWSMNPAFYLGGTNDGDGDNAIGIGFLLGSLKQGESITFKYSYVLGVSPDDAVGHIPTSSPVVPEPSTMLLLGVGLVGIAVCRHKRCLKKS